MTEIRYIMTKCKNCPDHFFIERMGEDRQPVGVSKQVFCEVLARACDDIDQQNFQESIPTEGPEAVYE